MKRALLIAPKAKFHTLFNLNNFQVLRELEYEVYACANFYNDSEETVRNKDIVNQLTEMGVGIINAPFVRKSLLKNIKVIKQLKRIIKSNYFDLIHVHTETGGFLFLISSLHSKKTGKYVYTPHGTSFYKGSSFFSRIVYKPIEKKIARIMNLNLSMNDEEKAFFDRCCPKTSKFIHGIGLDIDTISKTKAYSRKDIHNYYGVNEDSVLLLSVGELCSRKNHSIIIDALSKIKSKDVKYLIRGTGNLKTRLERKVKRLGLEGKVIFAGYRTDVVKIVGSCDIFVFPSIYEGLPVSVMEAMALKKPVVCSLIRGNRDLIEHGKGGFLVARNDADKYAKCLTELIENKKLREEFGNYNFEKVKMFSDKKVRKELRNSIVYIKR